MMLAPRRKLLRARAGSGKQPSLSFRLLDRRTLVLEAGHQVVPRFHERGSTLVLQSTGQGLDVDSGLGETGQNPVAVCRIGSQDSVGFAVISDGLEGALRHGVDRERRGKSIDIERVGGVGILAAGAGPKQSLRPAAGIGKALE